MQRHLFISFVIIALLESLSLECVGEDKCKNFDEYLGKMKAIYKHAQSPYDADRRLTDLAIQYEGKIPDYGKYGPVTVFGAMCVGCYELGKPGFCDSIEEAREAAVSKCRTGR